MKKGLLIGLCLVLAAAGWAAVPCRRVIPYSPALGALMFEMGLGDCVAGITRWTPLPPNVKRPIVGDVQSPDPEAVLAAQPDCILVQLARKETFEKIVALRPGIRLVVVEIEELADIRRAALLIGALTGQTNAAETAVAEFDRRLENVRRHAESPLRRRVLFVQGTDHPLVAGTGTFAAELIELAGGANAGAAVPGLSRWRMTELEAIIAAKPEVIVCQVDDARQESAARAYWEKWKSIPAVAGGRVHVVSGPEWTIPSLRMAEIAERLFEIIRGSPEKK